MSKNQERIVLFEAALQQQLQPSHLAIEDESHLHAGHAGAASGGGHFRITLTAPAFAGLNRVARHRLVYEALNAYIPTEIHALASFNMLKAEEAATSSASTSKTSMSYQQSSASHMSRRRAILIR